MNQRKVKLPNGILLTDIATIILIVAVSIIPSGIVRIVLGVPFILYFPGYVLISALLVRKENTNRLEEFALSIILSVAISAFIGLGLNYTTWGVTLTSVLYSISGFIFLISIVALVRRILNLGWSNLLIDLEFPLPVWRGGVLSKSLTVALAIALLGSLGTLGYISASPRPGEQFTEFYVLGVNGQAQDYPVEFIMLGNTVSRVTYGTSTRVVESRGRTTIGITNHYQQEESYSVIVKIDGQQVDINVDGKPVNQIENIELAPGANWQKEIGFAPQHLGDSQQVEFLLYKADQTEPEDTVHLWIDARPSP